MSEANWFYVDRSDRQIGPVTADEVRAALRRGDTGEARLAWCDGMADWQPIFTLGTELELRPGFEPGAPAPRTTLDTPPPDDANLPPPAAIPTAALPGPGDVVYGGFWRRFAAHVLDHVILFVPVFVLLVAVLAFIGADQSETDANRIYAAFLPYLGYFLIAPFYFAGLESSASQATFGKRALGIKVVDLEGRRLGFQHALGRWFASGLSYVFFSVGFMMAGFTDRKRALHDMVSSTQVVDEWAYSAFPERQQRGMSGCLIAVLVMLVGGFLVVPILAAISISQYQDYVLRSQVMEGMSLADGSKTAIAEYVASKGSLPQSNEAAGLPLPKELHGAYASYVDIGRHPGRVEVGFSAAPPQNANIALDGKHVLFDAVVDRGSVTWTCHSEDLKQKFCPSSCSCSG
ncbi:MAG: RDD family protein [Arenimonas sp.]